MKLLLCSLCLLLAAANTSAAIDLDGLEPIGDVSSYTKSADAVGFKCADGSEVTVSILAPDLIRVRASFKKPLPPRDHSWAIAKTAWDPVRWNLAEQDGSIVITTDELEVVVRRAPLLVEFRDARTHQLINGDFKPMMRDPKSESVAAAKRLGYEEHFYGLGEKAARLDKRRGQFTNWNSDTPAYKEGTDPIYQTIPFYMGLENGRAYGIFFDNSYRSHFDFGSSSQEYISFSAEGGEMNYYFFNGPSMKKVIGRYSDLTGHLPMPPMWALGHQQCRWSYYPQSLAEYIVRRYREEDLPLDALYLDIHYMQAYRLFTWDTKRFPDPKAFTARLRRQGVKVIPIVDAGIKYQPPAEGAADPVTSPELAPQDKTYYVYNQGAAKDYFVRRKNGKLYVGAVWPGPAVFADFTRDEVRRWWGDLHRAYTDNGVGGIWMDMNEPSDFVDKTGDTQTDLVFYDEGENSLYGKNRNVFASLMARATYEGLDRLQPNQRHYIITRAGYAGYQRYTTMWTGDNTATWETLQLSIPMYTTMGLSGVPFIGGDVGGFIGRSDGELLTRWYEAGFLTPMLRNHMQIDSYDHEPWRFGKIYEDIIRKYLKLRYRLLPFLYTQLEDAHRTGVPLFRPLILNYQDDSNAANLDDEFMIGADLLVAPVMKAGASDRLVYLPSGEWIDYWSGARIAGGAMIHAAAALDTVPMYVRAGAVIPMGPEMNYVGEKLPDPLTFTMYPDAGGQASGTLYEDDGSTQDYARGGFSRRSVSCSKSAGGLRITLGAPEGSYKSADRRLNFEVRSNAQARSVSVDGRPLAAIRPGDTRPGWRLDKGGIAIQIADNGNAHAIEIR